LKLGISTSLYSSTSSTVSALNGITRNHENCIISLECCWPINKSRLVSTSCCLIFTARRSYASAVSGVVILAVRPAVGHTRAL